jgi:pilus assembly protein CpaE
MLTAAIVTTDGANSAALTKCLQQTGYVYSVREWNPSIQSQLVSADLLPDLILLDLSFATDIYFALAAHVRQLRPTIHIVACSPQQPPDPALLLQAMRSGVQDILPLPLDVAALREGLARFAQEKEAAGGRVAEKLIVLMGAKGGVGTTTVAVNLGVQLAQVSKKHVALLDFARPLGHVSLLLDLQPRFSLRDAIENVDRLDGHFFGGLLTRHKSGLEILAGASHPEEWQRFTPPALLRVTNVAKSTCDYVLIDIGAQALSDWSSLVRQVRMILLIAEANVPSLWTLERQFSALVALGIDPERIRMVINRWRRGDEDALKSVEKNTKRPIFLRLPNDFRQVSEAVNLGVPLAGNHNNPLGSKIRQLACQLSGVVPTPEEKRRPLGNLFFLGPVT